MSTQLSIPERKPINHICDDTDDTVNSATIVGLTDEIVGLPQVVIPHAHLQRFRRQLVKRNLVEKLLQETVESCTSDKHLCLKFQHGFS